jgi:hypothetical protein
MASLTDYFERTAYKAKYEFGARVSGRWNKIPFIGTVYGDTLLSLEQGPRLSIHLDLPIKVDNKVYDIIIDTHRAIKDLKPLVDPFAPEVKRVTKSAKTCDSDSTQELSEKPKSRSAELLDNLKKLQTSSKKGK